MSKNLCAKTRPIDNPYEVWVSFDGTWTWKVLKKYQTPERESKNPYARWFCAVSSPITREQSARGYELGDVWVKDIKSVAFKSVEV
jgi:hypothetical protein